MSSVNQAVAALSPSLIGYLGNNPALALGNAVYKMSGDYADRLYKDASLKLATDEAAAKNRYYDGMIDYKNAALKQEEAEQAAKMADAAAARDANIAAIKANNPDFANSFVMANAKGGEYLDPTVRPSLEKGLAYVKLSDVKDKQPNLQHIQLKDGEIGVFNPQTGDVRGTGVKGDYVNPYSLASYKASLSLDTEEKRPTAKELGKKMASVADYIGKGYAAQGLTGDPAKDKIIKSYSFGSIDGKYLIPPAQIDSFKKEIGLR